MLHPNAGLEPSLTKQPTPLSAIDIEHEDFEWLRAYLQREANQTNQSGSESDVPIVGRKHKSHHSSSSSEASTCDSPTHRSSIDSYDDESDWAAPSKRRKVGWTSTEDLVILASVRKLGTQWPRIASQLPGRTADAVGPPQTPLPPPLTPSTPSHTLPPHLALRAPLAARHSRVRALPS